MAPHTKALWHGGVPGLFMLAVPVASDVPKPGAPS